MTTVPFFDAARESAPLHEEMADAMKAVIASGQYILGPNVTRLEAALADYIGVGHTIGVANGTDAILLSLKALGVSAGDLVVTTPFTFFATASAVVGAGATPVFCDIDPLTLNVSPDRVLEFLEGRSEPHKRLGINPRDVKILLPVHLFGFPAEMSRLASISEAFSLSLVEDAAQALGTRSGGAQVGSLGRLGAFSFFPTKNLGAMGDGGLISTNSPELAHSVRALRAHGSTVRYVHESIGTNSRLDELQAAILLLKLDRLEQDLKLRRENAVQYSRAFSSVEGVSVPPESEPDLHSFNIYTVRIRKERDSVKELLHSRGISTMVYYPLPLHLQPALAALGYKEGDLPEAERAAREVLSLPVFPSLTEQERHYVIESVRAALA